MPRRSRWELKPFSEGVQEVELFSWDYFTDFIYDKLLNYEKYVFRGHRRSEWKLESTLNRQLRQASLASKADRTKAHLAAFKYASRGRRGANPSKLNSENDWWALGQHFGLSTPLLDWTSSPYVGAFFAFEKKKHDDTARRVILALSSNVEEKSEEIAKATPEGQNPEVVQFIRPLSDENPRLVNQSGLFTRAPLGTDIESWVRQHFKDSKNNAYLIKITVPSSDRIKALIELNRMNINYLTLFPDLYGTSLHCNTALSIPHY
jgi:hypothetical protein